MLSTVEQRSALSVLVADDERSVLDVLAALIGAEDDLRLIGTATDADDAIATAVSHQPDVVLLDVRMPGGGGLRAAREIARRCPSTRVIALTAHEDEDTVIAMMAAGAHAYVPKGDSTDRILREIHRHPAASGAGPTAATGAPTVWGSGVSHRGGPGERRDEQRARVQRVIDDGTMRPAFQPIVELGSGRLVGVEAIARVAELPLRGGDAWFAEAESVGMLAAFEAAFIGAALRGLLELPESAFLSINVSPSVFASDEIQDALAAAPAARIILELTEHARVADYGDLAASLAPMRSRGFRLAVDDVGAGISRLRHVVMLVPDMVKLDSALTAGLDHDPTRHAVVAALADCAAQLGAVAVAAGVAGAEQVEALQAVGVTLGQSALSLEAGTLTSMDAARALNIRGRRADASMSTTTAVQPGEGTR